MKLSSARLVLAALAASAASASMDMKPMFTPLSCNENVEWDTECGEEKAVLFSELVANATATGGSEVKIDCGRCAIVDTTDGSQLEIPGGVNVEGMLRFPPDASVTLRTTHIDVQGVFKTDAPAAGTTVPAVGKQVKILFYGDDDHAFIPHADNMMSCDEAGCDVGKKSFVVAGGKLDVRAIDPTCPSWVHLLNSTTDDSSIEVSPEAALCWAAGAKIGITSGTTFQDDQETFTIVSSDSAGTLTLDRPVPVYLVSKVYDDEFPVEVALLNRNFVLDAEEDTANVLHGGHLMIMHSENVVQTLEGVEISNFGQQGVLGRYPIHFHMCETMEGSLISRNVVYNSHQRGVVIHASHNLTVSDNVLWDVKGHGYFLEDGVEQFNRFERNLATGIRAVATLVVSDPPQEESDKTPSCFWMSNTMNYFEGNVAAGSSNYGFWIEPSQGAVRGPSKAMPKYAGLDRKYLNLLHFKNNDAHSIGHSGMATYPSRYFPVEEAVIENLRSYKNKQFGLLLHVNKNIKVKGSVFADNTKNGISSILVDNVVVEGTRIMGRRQEWVNVMTSAQSILGGNQHIGYSACGMEGVIFSPNRYSQTTGMQLKDVHFSHFDDTNCGGSGTPPQSKAIDVADYHLTLGIYDSIISFENVTFADDTRTKISACAAESEGLTDLAFEDAEGSFDPTGAHRPGFLVSNNEASKHRAGGADACEHVVGSCLYFCPNVCLQTYTVHTPCNIPAVKLLLSSEVDSTVITESDKHHDEGSDCMKSWNIASFGFSIPAGVTHDAFFVDARGIETQPDFAKVNAMPAPKCASGLLPGAESSAAAATMLNVAKPATDSEFCAAPVGNTNFEADDGSGVGSLEGWARSSWATSSVISLDLVTPGVDGTVGTHAAKLTRGHTRDYLVHHLNVDCLHGADAQTYDISVKYRVVDDDGNGLALADGATPQVYAMYKSTPVDQWVWETVATQEGPYDPNGWNVASGKLFVSRSLEDAVTVDLAFADAGQDAGTLTGHFLVDDFSIVKGDPVMPTYQANTVANDGTCQDEEGFGQIGTLKECRVAAKSLLTRDLTSVTITTDRPVGCSIDPITNTGYWNKRRDAPLINNGNFFPVCYNKSPSKNAERKELWTGLNTYLQLGRGDLACPAPFYMPLDQTECEAWATDPALRGWGEILNYSVKYHSSYYTGCNYFWKWGVAWNTNTNPASPHERFSPVCKKNTTAFSTVEIAAPA